MTALRHRRTDTRVRLVGLPWASNRLYQQLIKCMRHTSRWIAWMVDKCDITLMPSRGEVRRSESQVRAVCTVPPTAVRAPPPPPAPQDARRPSGSLEISYSRPLDVQGMGFFPFLCLWLVSCMVSSRDWFHWDGIGCSWQIGTWCIADGEYRMCVFCNEDFFFMLKLRI